MPTKDEIQASREWGEFYSTHDEWQNRTEVMKVFNEALTEAVAALRESHSFSYRGDVAHQRELGVKCMCRSCVESRAKRVLDKYPEVDDAGRTALAEGKE